MTVHQWQDGMIILVTSVNKEHVMTVLPVCLSVCPPVCEQDYCKSNEPISLKLGATIGPNNREN